MTDAPLFPFLLWRLRHVTCAQMTGVLRLALPLMAANLSVPLLGAVDTAVMGHLPAPHYLGAVAVGALIFSFLYWGFGFLRLGTTGLVAQALGADDGNEARAVLGRGLVLAGVLAAAVLFAMEPVAALGFALIDASPDVETGARAYFSIRIWSAPATLATYVVLGWFIGAGRTRDVLMLQVLLNGLNALLDVVFVVGLGWGVEGVAVGTMLAEITAAAAGLIMIARTLRTLPGHFERARLFDRVQLLRLAAVNRDLFIRTLCLMFAFAWFTAMGALQGDVVLAANAVLLNFQMMMAYVLDAFAHAAESLIGHAIGLRDRVRLDTAVAASTALAGVFALAFTAAYALAGGFIIDLLTGLSEVRLLARDHLPWVVVSPLVSVWCFQLDGIFIGATRTHDLRNTMVVSTAVYLAVSLGALEAWGNHGLWMALILFLAFRGVTLGARYPALVRDTTV